VLRAKIDMASPNINMRDPVLYRIRTRTHHRTGDAWCIYPMYDFAHPPVGRDRAHHALALHARVRGSPAALRLAGREPAGADKPRQIEFARLNLTYTVMSKRKLLQLVQQKARVGWDDPRMPTIAACAAAATRRRRSATSASASAWPSARTSSTSRCSSTASARI
jgi:glutaminyl-tRNA synthetase